MKLQDIADGLRFAIDTRKIKSTPRHYLGMSQLGNECSRYLWYYFRWAANTEHSAKSERIFRRGDLEEPRVISYLESIGISVTDTQETMSDCNGHLSGHNDGIAHNIPDLDGSAILEIKTMSEKYFKTLQKNTLKYANYAYYCQVQVYCHYKKLKYGLFIAVNKNTEELYIEIIEYNKKLAEALVHKGIDIIYSKIPPAKLSDDSKYFKCSWCQFKKQCHEFAPYKRSCRTCEKSVVAEKQLWHCTKYDKPLNYDHQLLACIDYSTLKV